MSTSADLQKLRKLQRESDRLRSRLGISQLGEVIFQASRGPWSEADIVVEANGLGGARLLVVEGNYPIDYLIHLQKDFDNEGAACEAAEKMQTE